MQRIRNIVPQLQANFGPLRCFCRKVGAAFTQDRRGGYRVAARALSRFSHIQGSLRIE